MKVTHHVQVKFVISFNELLDVMVESKARHILILLDKSDTGNTAKLVNQYMKDVFETSTRPFEIKSNSILLIVKMLKCSRPIQWI